MNVNTYHRYEAGTRRLYWDKAVLLANVIGCSLDDLARPAAAGTVVLERQLADWDTELPEGLVIPEVTEVLRLEAPAVPPPPPRVLPEVLEVPGA